MMKPDSISYSPYAHTMQPVAACVFPATLVMWHLKCYSQSVDESLDLNKYTEYEN